MSTDEDLYKKSRDYLEDMPSFQERLDKTITNGDDLAKLKEASTPLSTRGRCLRQMMANKERTGCLSQRLTTQRARHKV